MNFMHTDYIFWFGLRNVFWVPVRTMTLLGATEDSRKSKFLSLGSEGIQLNHPHFPARVWNGREISSQADGGENINFVCWWNLEGKPWRRCVATSWQWPWELGQGAHLVVLATLGSHAESGPSREQGVRCVDWQIFQGRGGETHPFSVRRRKT